MAVKIAIAGTHSTGKTTFIESVQCKFEDKGCRTAKVNGLATEARDRGFPILREHTFSSTLWIMTRCISLELEASLSADVVLVDRPVLDAYGYLLAALKHRKEHLTQDETNYLESLIVHHAKTYQAVFKTMIDETRPIDGTKERDMDRIFRAQVADALDTMFSKLEIPFVPLSYDPPKTEHQIAQLVEKSMNAVIQQANRSI